MARANRHYIPGYVWHLTHRCHKKEFLLKFSKDRERWLNWLFEAKKRYGLCILNYCVTSNHIHLLVLDKICVPPKRYSLIDRKELLRIFGNSNSDDFSRAYQELIKEALEEKGYLKKDPRWTDNIAVGSKKFIEEARIKLGIQGEHKKILDNDGIFVLKEPISSYGQAENSFIWNFPE